MKCPKCNNEIPNDSKFCGFCGEKIANELVFCPQCGKKLRPKTNFCEECGYNLSKSQSQTLKNTELNLSQSDQFDTLVVECPVNDLNDCINTYKSFGYQYVSNQMVFSQTEKLNQRYFNITGMIKTDTVETKFLSVTFKRNRSIDEYDKMVNYEKDYNRLVKEFNDLNERPVGKLVPMVVFGPISIVFGILFTGLGASYELALIGLGVGVIIVGLALTIVGIILISTNKRINNQRDTQRKKVIQKMKELINQSKKLTIK